MRPWLPGGTQEDRPIAVPPLGDVLRQYRADHHLTQAVLGELLQVDQTYVSMIERRTRGRGSVSFLLHWRDPGR